jgi:hypothetical protein
LQSPPSSLSGGSDPSGTEEYPITAEVPDQKKKHNKSDILVIVVVLGSSIGLLMTCAVVLILLVRWKKLGRLHEAMTPATIPAVNRRYGMVFIVLLLLCFVNYLLLMAAWEIFLTKVV